MAEVFKISNKYTKEGKVQITDGDDVFVWTVKIPGAGTEMRMGQISRESISAEARISNIEKKIETGTATDEDLDRYDELVKKASKLTTEIVGIFGKVLNDGTKENTQVEKWIEKTPFFVINAMFEDIKNQQNGKTTEPDSKEAIS